MKKKFTPKSGLLIPRLSVALGLISAAMLMAWLSFAVPAPPNGTLTPGTTLTFTTGPNARSNPSAQTGAGGLGLICNAALPCEDYHLTVSVPANYGNTHDLVISTSWPIPAEDYDVYFYDENPAVPPPAKDAASSSNPEVVVTDANAGEYTIRVVPFAVAGGTTTTRIELRDKPSSPPPAPAGPGTPRYHNFAAPPNLGNSAGEPTLASGKAIAGQPNGRTMFIAALETLRVTWNDCPSPAAQPAFPANTALSAPLWEDKSFASTSAVTLDPILFGDNATGRIQVSQLGPKTSFLAYTDNEGGEDADTSNDYTPTQGSPINPGVDHQTVGGGPYNPTLEPPHPTHPNAVYYASQDVAVAQLGRSDTGGLTYGPAVPMYNLTQCGGLHGHSKVTPRSPLSEANGHVGTVYVPNRGCGGQQAVVVSENNGVTFAIRPVPGSVAGSTDPSVGIDKAGKIYVAMSDGTGRAKVAVSADKGVTWQTPNPIDVGDSFGIRNSVFATATAGDSGRATVMFLATTTPGNPEATGVFNGVWHIYASHTFDGGLSWTTVQVTPDNDPVQRGSLCTSGTTCGADRNLLDFNDMEIDQEGRVIMAYADGCIGCTDPVGSDSRSAKATIARQSGGMRMLAAFDPPVEPNAPAAPLVTSVTRISPATVRLVWSAPDNGGAPITGYNVFRKEGVGGSYVRLGSNPTTPDDKTTYDDATATNTAAQYFYKVTAINSDGEGTSCGEFLVGLPIDPGTSCILPGLLKLGPDPDTGGTSPTGGGPGTNILTVHIAQPYIATSGNPILLAFTISTDPNPTGTQPVGTVFFVSMNTPDGEVRGVRMAYKATPPPGGNPGDPTFESYLVRGNSSGAKDGRFSDPASLVPAEPGSGYDAANGRITIVVKASNLFASPGQALTGFNAAVTETTDFGGIGTGATFTIDEVPNGLGRGATSYTVQANSVCAPNAIPIARLSATPLTGDAPLTVNFDASASSDADAGDTLSFTFNFGDGTSSPPQSSPMISHQYVDSGNFQASVVVTDSKSAVSTNPAGVVIQVGLPLEKIVSRMTHGAAGDFNIDLPIEGPTAIEPRRLSGPNAGNFKIVYTFDRTVTSPGTASSNDPDATETVQFTPGTKEVTVNLTGVDNAQNLEVVLDNVQDSAGANLTGVRARMGVLAADVNSSRRADSTDVTAVRAATVSIPIEGTFRNDVNASGRIDSTDVTVARQNSVTVLP